jgi:hypothetical protein
MGSIWKENQKRTSRKAIVPALDNHDLLRVEDQINITTNASGIGGAPVSDTLPSSGQYLKFDGNEYVPTGGNLGITKIRGYPYVIENGIADSPGQLLAHSEFGVQNFVLSAPASGWIIETAFQAAPGLPQSTIPTVTFQKDNFSASHNVEYILVKGIPQSFTDWDDVAIRVFSRSIDANDLLFRITIGDARTNTLIINNTVVGIQANIEIETITRADLIAAGIDVRPGEHIFITLRMVNNNSAPLVYEQYGVELNWR